MEGKSNLFQNVFIDLTVLLFPRIIYIYGGVYWMMSELSTKKTQMLTDAKLRSNFANGHGHTKCRLPASRFI